jgi:class 3 adenylate cyclase
MGSAGFEYEGFAEVRAIARRRRRRILLPCVLVAIMLLALVGIAVHNYRAMHTDALALSEGVIASLQRRIETEVAAYLRPINRNVRLSHDLLAPDLRAGIPTAQVEAVATGMLRETPQLTALYAGNPRGEFVMVRRDQRDGREVLETKEIRRSARAADGFAMTLTRRNDSGQVISQSVEPWDQYDPRTRPWYQGADQHRRLHWTDVYPFFTDRAAGITVSVPVAAADGELIAVIGADVTLKSISRFLQSLSIGKTGQAVIVEAQGRLIAHPSAELVHDEDDGSLRLARIDDLGDPLIRRAFDYYRVEGMGHRDFALDGRRYVSAMSSLHPLIDRDWSVLVVVPEDDFVGFVVDNVRKSLIMGLSVIALAALLAWLLIREGLRADRDAVRILEREAALDAEGQVFGQLASAQTAMLDPNNPRALESLTGSASEAARVRRVSIWNLDHAGDALTCLDCFDRDTSGHTRGTRLLRQEYAELFAALEEQPLLAAVDAGADVRLSALHRHYLEPLGCRALLVAPIRAAGRLRGAVWLEDTGERVDWPDHTLQFAQALANLLAIRDDGAAATEREPAAGAPRATADAACAATRPEIRAAFRSADLDTSLGARRAVAFAARLDANAGARGKSGAEVIERLAVMSLHLTNDTVLAKPAERDSAETTMAQLLEKLQATARDEGVDYLKSFSDQVIASVDPNEDTGDALRRLARFALRARMVCETLFARHRAAPAFRIGIDVGPAIGILVGRERPAFAFWGEAVRTAASMADSSLPGAIQVTESVYRELRGEYLFQLRGHHYLEGIGEFSTYLLGGRL